MGMDMACASIAFRSAPDDAWTPDPAVLDAVMNEARRRIGELNRDSTIAELISDHMEVLDVDLDGLKRKLHDHLQEILEAINGEHRQGTMLSAGNGIVLLVSGGLSGGDSPTELYETMNRLHELDILPDARWPHSDREFWQRMDRTGRKYEVDLENADPDEGGEFKLINARIHVQPLGISIGFEGYGEASALPENATPIFIEQCNGHPVVRIWADINSEDPTHTISLEGAALSKELNPF